jgi:hypothetical protein
LLALRLVAQGWQPLGQVLLRPGFHLLSLSLKSTKCFRNSVRQDHPCYSEQCCTFLFWSNHMLVNTGIQ